MDAGSRRVFAQIGGCKAHHVAGSGELARCRKASGVFEDSALHAKASCPRVHGVHKGPLPAADLEGKGCCCVVARGDDGSLQEL